MDLPNTWMEKDLRPLGTPASQRGLRGGGTAGTFDSPISPMARTQRSVYRRGSRGEWRRASSWCCDPPLDHCHWNTRVRLEDDTQANDRREDSEKENDTYLFQVYI